MTAETRQEAAVIKRFRQLLCLQRDQFQRYLEVLNKQRNGIEQNKIEATVAYIEYEEQILALIFANQRVIESLEVLYRKIPVEEYPETQDIQALKRELEALQKQVKRGIEENKELLFRQMTVIASEIQALKGSVLRKRVLGGLTTVSPSCIDIEL
ncbi:MAG: hypothetical protein LBD29_02480 [Treponema sp.]|jgi:hypothetical protein|nr:hypothetical protein [Treponema sp.]